MEILSKYGNVKVEISGSSSVLWGNILGMLSNQTDLQNALNAKQDTLTLTTTGTSGAATLVGATLNIPQYSGGGSSSITIGTTAITSGTVGRVLFEGTGNVVQESANLFWDNTNNNLAIGTSTPTITAGFRGIEIKVATNLGAQLHLDTTDADRNASIRFSAAGVSRWDIFHDAATGALNFRDTFAPVTTPLILFNGGNVGINTTTDAGFRLDVNGTARVSGNLELAANTLNFADNGKARFGNSTDLEIYHDGSNSYINESGTGDLYVQTNGTNMFLRDSASGNTFIAMNVGTADVALRQGNNIKLRTTSTGVAVTGNVLINTTTDAGFRLDVNGTARVNSTTTTGLTITQGASGDAIVIQNAGYIQMASTRFRAFDSAFQFQNISYNTKVNLSMSGFSYFNSGGNYTFGSTTEVFTALLNLDSTTRGFLPPRMTTTQKNAIASPAAGLVVYDTDLNALCTYNGTTWITLGSGGSASSSSGIHVLTEPITGFYYSQITITGTSSLGAGAFQQNGSLQLFPFVPANTLTCDLMQFEIVTAAASALSKIAIYSDVAGKPSAKLYESPDTDSSTTGFKTVTTSFTFTGGTTYWIGLVSNSNSIQPRAIPSANFQPLVYQNGTNQSYNGWYISAAYGSLPATTTVTSSNTNMISVPYISFRQA